MLGYIPYMGIPSINWMSKIVMDNIKEFLQIIYSLEFGRGINHTKKWNL